MYYESIHLKKFKRMYLSGIREFKLNLPDAVTLILGTNGSGKSCLLNELSPLPGGKDAFEKDGYKEVVIEHHSKRYKLITTFSNGVKCQFIRLHDDGREEELNPGGTQSVQKTLVEEVFGYTDLIHNLINNKLKFTDMTPVKRREWFTLLSNVDYDYVINLFMRMREKQRDLQGYIKEQKNKLLQLEMVKDDPEYVKQLLDETNNLQELINGLQSVITGGHAVYDVRQGKEAYLALEDELKRVFNMYTRKNNQLHLFNVNQPLEEMIDDMNNKRVKLAECQTRFNTLNDQLMKYEKDIQLLEDNQVTGENDIDNSIHRLNSEIRKLVNERQLDIELSSNPQAVMYYLNDIKASLIQILSQIPFNDGRYSKRYLDEMEIELHDITENIRRSKLEREKTIELSRVLEDKRLTCPHCKETFIPGTSEAEQHRIKHVTKEHDELLDNLNKRREELTPLLNEQKAYLETRRAYADLRLGDSPLKDYHAKIMGTGLLNVNPNDAITLLSHYEMDLNNQCKIKEHENEIRRLETVQKSLAESGLKSRGHLLAEMDKLGNELNSLHGEKDRLNKEISDLGISIQLTKEVNELRGNLEVLLKKIDRKSQEYTRGVIENGLREEIDKLRLTQSTLLNNYTKIQFREQTVAEAQKNIEEAERKERAYGLIVEELSPNKGMIAEGLFGFVKHFLKDMNTVISKIWTYPLTIAIADEMDDKGLTYRFPMLTGIGEEEIPDVNIGSAGIKEIVNLAFKIVSMKYLKISDYPLILDEFGAAFDSIHRIQAGKAINTLISTREHQQLFMVSHYADAYGSLTNCNICVLDDSNIVLPLEKYNQHVEIKYAGIDTTFKGNQNVNE